MPKNELLDRRGRFILHLDMLSKDIETVWRVMKEVIVTNCRGDFSGPILKYSAISPMFEPVALGYREPLYQFLINEAGDLVCRQIDVAEEQSFFWYGEIVSFPDARYDR